MPNDLKVTFTDKSTIEDGFRIYVDDVFETEIKHVGTANKVQGGDLLNTVSADKQSIDEQYKAYIADVNNGNVDVDISSFNKIGESTKIRVGNIEIYNRTDFVMYIGDEEVAGTGDKHQLQFIEGYEAELLSETIDDAVMLKNIKTTEINQGEWRKADPNYEKNVGAEVSFIDAYQSQKTHRKTAIWKLCVPKALASTSFALGGEAYEYIENNINQHFNALMGLYHQPRLKAVIVNMDLKDANVRLAYQNLIDWLRSFFNMPELPIILTDRSEQSEKQELVDFKIEHAGGVIGDFYEMRGMLGYYRQPWLYRAEGREIQWDKVYDLKLNEINTGHRDVSDSNIIWHHGYYSNRKVGSLEYDIVWGLAFSEIGTDETGNRMPQQNLDYYASELGIPLTELVSELQGVGMNSALTMQRTTNSTTYGKYVSLAKPYEFPDLVSNKRHIEFHFNRHVRGVIIRGGTTPDEYVYPPAKFFFYGR